MAGWLSRSAWSLALIALWRKLFAPNTPCVFWIPDFFCNSTLLALRHTGAKLVFYPITDDLSPDFAACRSLAESDRPAVFLLVHFFGRPSPSVAAREFCQRHGTWLVEDATHVLRPVKGIGETGDFVLYSPHKHLAIPDGAVLVARAEGASRLAASGVAQLGAPDSWSARLGSLQIEGGTRSSELSAWIWLAKRVLQKLGVTASRHATTPYAESVTSGQPAAPALMTPGQSWLSRHLLTVLLPTLPNVVRQRQRNRLLWDAALLVPETASESNVSAGERCIDRAWIPYLASYCVATDRAADIYESWCRRGMRATTWPDLPPEVIADRAHHAVAWTTRHSRVYLPVHQTLRPGAMLRACGLADVMAENDVALRVIWNEASGSQWQAWLAQAGRSNLLQSWAYGEAKADQGGWRAMRGVFYLDEEPVALVQMLQKRIAGVITVSRINRGPLFLRDLSQSAQTAIWRMLSRFGRAWRGQLLTIAPELDLTGTHLRLMAQCGLRQFTPRAWESIWIDLTPERDALRQKLDSKWRNMLTFAEKAGLTLEIGSDDAAFEWLMARYESLMQAKDFQGPPVALLRRLRQHAMQESPLLVLRAMQGSEPVAGICLACHGQAATYLVGWNGAQGRTLKANQYLLWQAVEQLKQRGLRWFDLGGIDEDNTPGIAAFKSGMNGERYELVGEYWKW